MNEAVASADDLEAHLHNHDWSLDEMQEVVSSILGSVLRLGGEHEDAMRDHAMRARSAVAAYEAATIDLMSYRESDAAIYAEMGMALPDVGRLHRAAMSAMWNLLAAYRRHCAQFPNNGQL